LSALGEGQALRLVDRTTGQEVEVVVEEEEEEDKSVGRSGGLGNRKVMEI